jgi:hypothetical protein
LQRVVLVGIKDVGRAARGIPIAYDISAIGRKRLRPLGEHDGVEASEVIEGQVFYALS